MTIHSRVKPKEIMVNLPAAHLFATEDEIPALAAAINTIIHGKVKIKCENLGVLGGQYVGLAMVVVEDTAVVSGFTREAAAANFCIFESVANCEPVPPLDTGKMPVT